MSDIVLSASTRQNLLSLQSTAQLLATTQDRLSTGKKVNSALDNPTNFFTAQGLDNRASDINNLLDSIGNGVQVLQAANTGLTSLQKLVDSAKAVATQALQATVGYSQKSSVSVSINGATASNILGTGAPIDGAQTYAAQHNNQSTIYSASTGVGTAAAVTHTTAYIDATAAGTAATGSARSAYTSTTTTGSVALQDSASAAITSATKFDSGAGSGSKISGSLSSSLGGQTLTINGNTITFSTSATATTTSGNNTTIGLASGSTSTFADLLTAIGTAGGSGVSAAIDGSGHINITSGTSTDVTVSGSAASTLGLATVNRGGNVASTPALTGSTVLSGTATAGGAAVLSSGFAIGDTITVDGKTLSFVGSGATGPNQINTTDTVTTLLSKIDGLSGGSGSSISGGGVITLHTGTTADLSISSSNAAALTALGLSGGVSQARSGGITSTTAASATTHLNGPVTAGAGGDGLTSGITASDYLVVNGKTITFNTSGTGNTGSIAANNLSIDVTSGTINDILTAIGQATGGTATVNGSGQISLTTTTGADISLSGSNAGTLSKLGLGTLAVNGNPATATTTIARTAAATPFISSSTLLSGAASNSSNSLGTAFAAGDTITVNGQNLTFVASGATGNNQINIGDTVGTLLAKIDVLSGNVGGTASTVNAGGQVVLHTGTTSDLTISSSNAAALTSLLGVSSVNQARGAGASPLAGQTLQIAATGGGTPTSITFGTGGGQISTLNDLNTALAANHLQATLASNGTLTITTSNDAASSTIGAITGTAAASGQLFYNATISAPVADPAATALRNGLVDQYNNILNQITTTSQDASFNGINLLSGDTLKLVFNENGSSTLGIKGVNFNAAGLGLAALNYGDFKDGGSVQQVVGSLQSASTTLRSQASAFGSNLTIVQIRQDFNKNLINVLQTGSSSLTLADTNEEAANSQALSTRQSIAVSALALANQSQQSVLQLLK